MAIFNGYVSLSRGTWISKPLNLGIRPSLPWLPLPKHCRRRQPRHGCRTERCHLHTKRGFHALHAKHTYRTNNIHDINNIHNMHNMQFIHIIPYHTLPYHSISCHTIHAPQFHRIAVHSISLHYITLYYIHYIPYIHCIPFIHYLQYACMHACMR